MNLKTLLFGYLTFLIGFGALIHHRIVAGVLVSYNQTFYECHGKMGVITTGLGMIVLGSGFLWNGGKLIG